MYRLEFTPLAVQGALRIRKSDPAAYKKLEKLLIELQEHPTTGTGRVEPLRGDKTGLWSRRITARHRLVYRISESEIKVLVISTTGHYDDR